MANPNSNRDVALDMAECLTELALDLRWTWNHSTDDVWRELDPELWEATQNAWLVLQTVSRERLNELMSVPRQRRRVDLLLERKRTLEASDAWFQRAHPDSSLTGVAYFSMEYMLSEALPIYSGGLGNVAGDQLKTASDLGVPVIGIGLLYQQGYFRQEIDSGRPSGALRIQRPEPIAHPAIARPRWRLASYEVSSARLRVVDPGWGSEGGRRKLYLLDTNDPANVPGASVHHR